ncbi:MAG TPA: SH3 domain-containing protein [Anaeromyxobacteraceae bacterium]|nr:SH3 domain-containing protein [Anaeromyxobacteraceae bacterium]
MIRFPAIGAALLVGALACSREPAKAPPRPSAPPPPPAGDTFLTASASLRREPTEAARVKVEPSRAAQPNALALLQRGERVTSIEHRGEWTRVRASDGTEGWVRSSLLLPAEGVFEGTVLAQVWAFDRPDLLAVNVRRKVDPGTLLLVVKTKELFSEVDIGQGQDAWILSDRISTDPKDVMGSKLVEKARALLRGGRLEEARAILDLLRSQVADSALIPVLATELGEVAADGGAADGRMPDGGAPPSPSR